MRIRSIPCLLMLFSFIFFSCVETHYLAYEASPRTPNPAGHPVEIIDVQNIDSEYKIIGEITVFGDVFSSSQEMRKELFERARIMGGDAIIEFESTFASTGHSDKKGHHHEGSGIVWKGKVIVFQE